MKTKKQLSEDSVTTDKFGMNKTTTTTMTHFVFASLFLMLSTSGCSCSSRIVKDESEPAVDAPPVTPPTLNPPTALSYSPSQMTGYNGDSMSALTPAVTGLVTTYSISPSLPTGLSINAATGIISGTATTVSPSTGYTVTATNADGSTTSTITLVVGAVFTVNATSDQSDATPGDGICNNGASACTLRAAVQEANALAVPTKINVPVGTYNITNGEIPMTANIKIVATNRATTILDAGANSRIFNITSANASVESLTMQNGHVGNAVGGAVTYVNSTGTLTLTDVSVLNSTSAALNKGGAGIYFAGLNLNLTNALIKGNAHSSAGGSATGGGGLYLAVTSGSVVNVTNVIFQNNTTNQFGGGARLDQADSSGSGLGITFSDVTFLTNTANNSGGAIYDYNLYSKVQRSLFQGNVANSVLAGGGGAIYTAIPFGQRITNSTFYANTTAGKGGAVYLTSGIGAAPAFTNNTFANNSATAGGGIYFNLTGSVDLKNNILTSNSGGNCNSPNFAIINSTGYNIDSANTCGFATTGDLVNTDPLLVAGAPVANGGLTNTMALQAASPARDSGSPTGFPTTDQRGNARPNGGACDIGAYEY